MNNTTIEWTDKTWNPVTGCTKVSQGCKNCYAEKFYERFHGKGSFKKVTCHDDRLAIPSKWKTPSFVFVNSMSDLFHEDVPFEFINAVFTAMSDCDKHTFQVLTKRPERMMEFYNWKRRMPPFIDWMPSFNVWMGVSVEDQSTADSRIPLLLSVPAYIHFLSCEPLLSEINLNRLISDRADPLHSIDWVIVGGESGLKARKMESYWAEKIQKCCQEYSIRFFFKQWGAWGSDGVLRNKKRNGRTLLGKEWSAMPDAYRYATI